MSSTAVAQTAPQLWAQLARAGWAISDLERLHRVYQVSERLFTGRARECRKPFVDHLVGTASVVASVRADPDLVGGALLHAAYTHNVFDDLGRGATGRRRRMLRRLVGAGIETHVYRYTTEPWTIERVRGLLGTTPDRRLADVVLLRIANEVDEHLDGAMRLDPKRDEPLHDPGGIRAHAALARHYGWDALAEQIGRVAADAAALPELPPSLRSTPGDHHIALPLWARPTLRRRVRTALGRIRRWWIR